MVARILGDVLRKPSLGVDDDFFTNGGDSIRAMQAAAAIRDELDAELPLHILFEAPTAKELVQLLLHDPTSPRDRTSPAVRATPGANVPASFQQEQLWLSEKIDSQSTRAYVLSFDLEYRGTVDPDRLKAAWRKLQTRHTALRLRFTERDEALLQSIEAATELTVLDHRAAALGVDAVVQATHARLSASIGTMTEGRLLAAEAVRVEDEVTRIVVSAHHAILDAFSVRVAVTDFIRIYEQADGSDLGYSDYREYAARQRSEWTIEDSRVAAAADAHRPPASPATLPASERSPAARSYRGETVSRPIDAELSASVRCLAEKHGATPFMVLLAAAASVLSDYSGQRRLTLGVPCANRLEPEAGPHGVGFYANVAPVSVELRRSDSGTELLEQVRQASLNAYRRESVPFLLLANRLHAVRDHRTNPVYQFLVGHHHKLGTIHTESGIWALQRLDSAHAFLDLQLEFEETAREFTAVWRFDTSAVESGTVQKMADDLDRSLRTLVEHPERELGATVRTVAPSELVGAATEAPVDDVLTMVARHAAQHPHAVAVRHGGQSLDYIELLGLAGAAAAELATAGVSEGDRVGILLKRTERLVVALLAAWQIGAVCVPLGDDLPDARLATMRDVAGLSAALVDDQTHSRVDGWGIPGVRLDQIHSSTLVSDLKAHQRPAAAYVMFTSGTTGEPRGVLVGHAALASRITALAARLGASSSDTLLATSPITFDISLLELLLPLCVGGAVDVAPALPDGIEEMVDRLQNGQVTLLQATPFGWECLLETGWSPEPPLQVLVGGDALPPELAVRLVATGCQVTNLYGPTEATIWATAADLTEDTVDGAAPRVQVGQPLRDTSIRILDGELSVVPKGVLGQVWIDGEGLATGYLRRNGEITELPGVDPSTGGPGYPTGDLGRITAEGRLEIHGRLDDQLKVHGYRVEPAELEACLLRHPEVEAAAVTAMRTGGAVQLQAFYRPAPGSSPDPMQLRAHMAATLPPFLIPAVFRPLDRIPVTRHGKTDRRALRDDLLSGATETDWTPAETAVAALWAEVLGSEPADQQAHFFASGGSSLHAIRMVNRLNSATTGGLTVRAFFDNPTVAGVAALLETDPATALGATPHAGPTAGMARVWNAGRSTGGTAR
ncbi:AMP-binding protein [Streptomyces sp. NPDC079020]|uniref:non-ribosomal peptide synthetase n=1 Tax=Streptomyces sp. NPDC079020 TaxID=3365722 RepID=UPI0037D6C545